MRPPSPHHPQQLPHPSNSAPLMGPLPTGGQRKKSSKGTTGVRSWLLMDSGGKTQVMEAGKHVIMRRTGLPARDLRILDPVLMYPSTVLGRERAIVINLEHIKAIVTAHEVLLVKSTDPSVSPFVDELQRRLIRHNQVTTAALEGNEEDGSKSNWTRLHDLGESQSRGESRENSPKGFSDQFDEQGRVEKNQLYGSKVLPFEFVALEACLESACSCLENEAKRLEEEAYPALDKLSSKISTLNLERVRQIKSRLVAITGRVQKVRDELEHLLDDDEDMAEMYLTEKSVERDLEINSSASSSMNEPILCDEMDDEIVQADMEIDRDAQIGTTTTNTSKQLDVQELEMLLEAYFVQIDGILNKLSTVHLRCFTSLKS
ncbi:magnesium transporter MRS2-3-like isoform X2 [Prunus dulcis]|uniref:magnesium transporter MRS2-3-like isoform X2 n=1 Tax=Prunus dulcis TaxID=3755 RepID=UPI001481E1D3|nr:magnesium transporter MRS2-3-like isoform X2 [Prunus dulcis]